MKYGYIIASIFSIFLSQQAIADTILVNDINSSEQYDTSETFYFVASDTKTTVSFAGYQLSSFEFARYISLTMSGSTTNLLDSDWTLTPAAEGSWTHTFDDGTPAQGLTFGGTTEGDYDSYSQIVSTIIGETYTLDFYFSNESSGSNGFMVSVSADPLSEVPEPAAVTLLGTGLIGLGLAKRRKASAPSQH